MRILMIVVLSLLVLPVAAKDNLSDEGWTTGLFCESVSPDRALNNFFIINTEKAGCWSPLSMRIRPLLLRRAHYPQQNPG